jgi:hypothetical protein
MNLNINTVKLYYAEDIKRYARVQSLTKSEIEDLIKKTKFLFGLTDSVDVERYIKHWKPEDFIIKVDSEIDRICDEIFEATEGM